MVDERTEGSTRRAGRGDAPEGVGARARRRSGTGLRSAAASLGLAALLLSTGCSGDVDVAGPGERTGRTTTWPTVQLASALARYDSCDDLLDQVKADALDRVGPYGLGGEVFTTTGATLDEVGGAAEGGPPASAPTASAADDGGTAGRDAAGGSSSTNVQVAGVDEPDSVKLDGTTMYSTVDGRLLVTDLRGDAPARTATLDVGTIDVGATSAQLLLDGDHLLVLSRGWAGHVGVAREDRSLPIEPGVGAATTELQLVDVSDPSNPRVVAHRSVDGSLLGARMVEGRARLVTATAGHDLGFVHPSASSGEAAAEAANRRVIEESTVEDWLPHGRTLGPDGAVEASELLVDCEDVSHPGVYSGPGTLTVLSVDLAGGSLTAEDAVAIQAAGETIYSSADTLYVATNEVLSPELADDPQQAGEDDLVTAVHAFDISGEGPATYLATGEVEGRLLNQFSMDEHDGVLRVATTVGPRWGGGAVGPPELVGPTARSAAPSSESFVTTLERRDGELVELGKVGDMGHGEQIHSVRFLGDVGYVVTFRQTDPLYTLDLADPSSPTVTGELKIPGFSSYLHPTAPGTLIGIGQDATETGGRTGTQVSVFDVTDPADPRRTAQWTLPGGRSTAEGDHHAFLWWSDDDLLVIPASGGTVGVGGVPEDGWFEGAIGLDVSDTAITERGRIVHGDLVAGGGVQVADPTVQVGEPWIDPGHTPPIVRALVVDGRLVTISHAGIMVSSLDTLTQLGWLPTAG